jgi:hypothetical protein
LGKYFVEPELYYWQREVKGSAAEVDYLWQTGEYILPIEVKAGKTGTLKGPGYIFLKKTLPSASAFLSTPYRLQTQSCPFHSMQLKPFQD